MTPDLSLIFSYRNRNVERVSRCLQSLANQQDGSFKVIFVDYGTEEPLRSEIETLVSKFDFIEYIHSNTQKQFWNRSIALNIGIKKVDTPFYATTDIDLIFEPDFIQTMRSKMAEDKFLHGHALMLEKDFSDYDNLDKLNKASLKQSTEGMQYGLFQLVPTKVMMELEGFDEFYRIWGLEDVDLNKRLKAKGLSEHWLDPKESHTWHQWHPHINDPLFSRTWYKFMEDYFFRHDTLQRNYNGWGKILTEADRPLLTMAKQIATQLHEESYPQRRESLLDYQLIDQRFEELASGEALELVYKNETPQAGFFEKVRNSLAHRIKVDFKVDLDRYHHKYTDYISACRHVQWLIARKDMAGSLADYTFKFSPSHFKAKLLKR